MTAPRSRTGRQLAKAAHAAGWTVTITPGHGTTRIPDPDRPHNGDGTRPNRYLDVPIESEAIRMRHPDGQHAVAVFATLNGKNWDAADKPNAWLRDPHDWPRPIGTDALLAHLTPERTTP